MPDGLSFSEVTAAIAAGSPSVTFGRTYGTQAGVGQGVRRRALRALRGSSSTRASTIASRLVMGQHQTFRAQTVSNFT